MINWIAPMFLNIIMLAGIGGAAVPLVLHLLSRARYRSAPWGAMMFLQLHHAGQGQGIRLRQWTLLAVRMALIALLAITLARPIAAAGHSAGALGQTANLTAVILLDNSASMGYGPAGRSRADQARQVVRQLLSTLRRGDQAALIVLGDPAHAAPAPAPTADLQSISDILDSPRLQTPGYGVADMADGLTMAADVLSHSGAVRRELIVVCDRQALNWRNVNDQFAADWRARVNTAGHVPRFLVVPVGGWESDNVAIESLTPTAPQLLAGQPAEVAITVRNYGAAAHGSIPLTLEVDGRAAASTVANVAAHASATVLQTLTLTAPGSHVITARIETADAMGDNSFSRAVDVESPINVLVVRSDAARSSSSRASTESASTESATTEPASSEQRFPVDRRPDYLKAALMPFSGAGRAGPDLAAVRIVQADALEWGALDSRLFRVLILDDIGVLTAAQAQTLEQHVYGGGGLLISPGAHTVAANLNGLLYREGSGIMPAALSPATAADASGATSLARLELSHPIFGFLAGKPDQIPQAAILRYFPLAPISREAQVLASYASGGPFLVAGTFGRGHVVLASTPLNEDWSTLPRSGYYLPLVQSIVRFLAQRPSRNLSPGQPIVAQFDDALGPAGMAVAQVQTPAGRRLDVRLQEAGDQFEARYADTAEPGIYRLSTLHQNVHFVISPPRDEADPTPASPQRWEELSTALGFTTLDPTRSPLDAALQEDRSPRELWLMLLMAVLGLGVAEVLLGRLWSDIGPPLSARSRA